MAEKRKKAAKKEEAPAEKGSKTDIIKAVKDMPKASNLVLQEGGKPVKYETVKRDDVVALLNELL